MKIISNLKHFYIAQSVYRKKKKYIKVKSIVFPLHEEPKPILQLKTNFI